MAPCMAANRPFPPSPRRAGPKHSGRLMSSLTTTLAFSSTLSPKGKKHYYRLIGENNPGIDFFLATPGDLWDLGSQTRD